MTQLELITPDICHLRHLQPRCTRLPGMVGWLAEKLKRKDMRCQLIWHVGDTAHNVVLALRVFSPAPGIFRFLLPPIKPSSPQSLRIWTAPDVTRQLHGAPPLGLAAPAFWPRNETWVKCCSMCRHFHQISVEQILIPTGCSIKYEAAIIWATFPPDFYSDLIW